MLPVLVHEPKLVPIDMHCRTSVLVSNRFLVSLRGCTVSCEVADHA